MMSESVLSWIKHTPLVIILAGLIDAGRLIIIDGIDGLIVLANGCRDLRGAGLAEILLFFSMSESAYLRPIGFIGGGLLLWVGWMLTDLIRKNWDFFGILNYYCNLMAESLLNFSPDWRIRCLVWPIKVCFLLLALILIPINLFFDWGRPSPERRELEIVENDLSTIEV